MKYKNIGFIGLGLIGGSVAKAIRRVYPMVIITCYDRSKDVLEMAYRDGIITVIADEDLSEFAVCDLIFLCVPVVTALQYMDKLLAIRNPKSILSDVGSVKGGIHRYVEEHGISGFFIGGHPMAGSEKTGYSNSTDQIINNALYILTPEKDVPKERVYDMKEMLQEIGTLPIIMDYQEHDMVTAAISHLPHVISASLVNLIHDSDGPEEHMRTIAAGGFRDITRISSSSPQMWQEICLSNPENICFMLDKYIAMLEDYRQAIGDKNAEELIRIFTDSKAYRDSFDTRTAFDKDKSRFYINSA